eukprot:scaffold1627_cov126-Isochrysis_galbana.AAC.5
MDSAHETSNETAAHTRTSHNYILLYRRHHRPLLARGAVRHPIYLIRHSTIHLAGTGIGYMLDMNEG